MKEEPVGKRIEKIIAHYGLTKNSFSHEIDIQSNTIVTRIVNDPNRAPSFGVMQKIAKRYPEISMSWLVTGKGEMIKAGPQVADSHIRYFNISNAHQMKQALKEEIEPTSIMNIHGFGDCDWAFDVVGDTMSPRYNPGEVVLCKNVNETATIPGEAFLVIAEHQQFIRYLKEVTPEGDFVFHSENKLYSDIEINPAQLQHLCIIKGKIRREVY